MSRLSEWFRKLEGQAPETLIFAPVQVNSKERFEADACYAELFVESLRLSKARRFATTFNGVVYSFVSMSREGEKKAEIAGVSKPQKLAQLDSKSLDKVITVSKQMMGPVPWRGGTFDLQLGLFSVKTGNLLTPVLDYVTKVSSAAGFSFVGAVKPFLPLITEGLDLIAGQGADTAIEVAVDTAMKLESPGTYAIINAKKGSIDPNLLNVDPKDQSLLLGKDPVATGYCVFSIRRTEQKADYGEIPELKEKYAALQAAIRSNKRQDADDALTAFRLAAITCPDLISKDAKNLVQKAREKVEDAFESKGLTAPHRKIETLAQIGLYDEALVGVR